MLAAAGIIVIFAYFSDRMLSSLISWKFDRNLGKGMDQLRLLNLDSDTSGFERIYVSSHTSRKMRDVSRKMRDALLFLYFL